MRKETKCQLTDVKVVSSAEIGSDDYLLLIIIKLKTKGQRTRESKIYSGGIRVEGQLSEVEV